jgi:hypothetical protein
MRVTRSTISTIITALAVVMLIAASRRRSATLSRPAAYTCSHGSFLRSSRSDSPVRGASGLSSSP